MTSRTQQWSVFLRAVSKNDISIYCKDNNDLPTLDDLMNYKQTVSGDAFSYQIDCDRTQPIFKSDDSKCGRESLFVTTNSFQVVTHDHASPSQAGRVKLLDASSDNRRSHSAPGGSRRQIGTRLCSWCRLPLGWRKNSRIVGVICQTSTVVVNGVTGYPAKSLVCCDECHLAYLKAEPYSSGQQDRIALVERTHATVYGSRLQPSPAWQLLDSNGGSLSYKKFFSKRYKYIKTGQLVYHQCKEVYAVERM